MSFDHVEIEKQNRVIRVEEVASPNSPARDDLDKFDEIKTSESKHDHKDFQKFREG